MPTPIDKVRAAIREADYALTQLDNAKREADAKLSLLAAVLKELQEPGPPAAEE